MARIRAHGLSIDPPSGWDGEIYVRDDAAGGSFGAASAGSGAGNAGSQDGDEHDITRRPIMHLSTVPLPNLRGDLGGGVVERLGPNDIFLVLFEYEQEAAGTALFGRRAVPWPLALDDFDASTLRTALAGQVGCQRFFSVGDRAFMLYVVLGSDRRRRLLVPTVNRALATVEIR